MADSRIEDPKPQAPERRPIEHWAAELKPPAWLAAGAKQHKRWAQGQEVTREAYKAALDAVANMPLGQANRFLKPRKQHRKGKR